MKADFDDFINNTFQIKENKSIDKVMPLSEAIKKFVKPGEKVHMGTTHCCSNAAIIEIARQFYGKKPGFILVMRGMRDTSVILIHLGLVKKVITSFSGNVYPSYGPNAVTQKAYSNHDVELEDWTILTFPLMLMAGALGTGFATTNSIVGSGMEKDNAGSFKVIDDPFEKGKKIGLIKALNPDISIVHGVAADREGNVILTPPYSESVWGAKASKGGVIATVEKLVSGDFIREHSHMVKIPGYMVKAVCVVPMGAHPGGVWNQGVASIDAYGEDYVFMTEFNKICRDPKALDTWINDWVLSCNSFKDYVAKLGSDRVLWLKGSADTDAWKYHLDNVKDEIDESPEFNVTEMMVVAAAREIKDSIKKNGHEAMLAGAGTANLAAWMAKYQLQKENRTVELMVELGYFGNSPRPAEPFLLNFGNFPTCKILTETIDTLGVFTGGSTNKSIGVLGGGQVDKYGAINSTWMAADQYLTGSGGANDVASGASEVIIVMNQSKKRFLDKLYYTTAPGKNVSKLVSSLGVFEKLGNDEELTLTKYFSNSSFSSKVEIIKNIRENCGWDLKVADNLKEITAPTPEELLLLRVFDPKRFYTR